MVSLPPPGGGLKVFSFASRLRSCAAERFPLSEVAAAKEKELPGSEEFVLEKILGEPVKIRSERLYKALGIVIKRTVFIIREVVISSAIRQMSTNSSISKLV